MTQKNLRYSDFWDRIDIDAFEEAIGFEPLEERNGNDIGYCLWPENHSHGDTTGKFGIHREKRVYNCYVCGGGSLLSLVMELKEIDVEEATEWLYQFCNHQQQGEAEFVDDFLASFEDVQHRIETLPYFNERVLDQHSKYLPHWWLEERGISAEVASECGVRYNEDMRRPAPTKGKFADDFDYYGPAIIFPHYWQGRLVGWQCRWLENDRPEWVPKYTLTSDFPKAHTIWGFDLAEAAKEPVVVVESVPSALFVKSCGYPAVATFGSNVNDAQMRLLRRFSNGVILIPDNDAAGQKWVRSNTDYLKRYIPTWVVDISQLQLGIVMREPGADIGDLAVSDSPKQLLRDCIESKFDPTMAL